MLIYNSNNIIPLNETHKNYQEKIIMLRFKIYLIY